MSTATVRNLINNTVTRVLVTSKKEIKEQGKKQVLKLKQQIPSPQDLIDELKTDSTQNNCTGKGKEKFENKFEKTQAKLERLQKTIGRSLDKLESVEGNLKKLVSPDGTLSKISAIAQILQPIVSVLGVAVIVAKVMVKVYGHIPLPPNGGGTPSGPIFIAEELKDLANGKIGEFSALVLSLTIIVQLYTKKANKILNLITRSVERLKSLKDQIDRLVAISLFMKLDQEEKCDELLNQDNGATGTGTGDPSGFNSGGLGVNTINGDNIASLADGMTLDDLIAYSEQKYSNMLANLKAQGDTKALEKITLLQTDIKGFITRHNISFKIINI